MATSKKSIVGTRTEKNLVAAYMAESMAYTRYMYYAKQAEKDGYPPIARIFTITASNEMHHSKVFFKFLQGGRVSKEMTIDSGVIGTTLENLKTAAAEEQAEGVEAYTKAAKEAREEGFDDIALVFESIAEVELTHEQRFRRFIKHLEDGTLYKRDKPVKWQCLVCGYEYEGTEPPTVCPACSHPQKYYMEKSEMVDAVND